MLLQQVGEALEERQFDRLGECNSVMISVAAAGWRGIGERQFDELGECNSVMISAAAAGWRGIGGTSVRRTGRMQ